MGFFQDLKEDLSMAVNELIPEGDVEELEVDNVNQPQDEDLFREAVNRLDEHMVVSEEDNEIEETVEVAAEEVLDDEETVIAEEETLNEEILEEEILEDVLEEVFEDVVEEIAIEQNDMSKEMSIEEEVYNELENGVQETELEKEVDKVMANREEVSLSGEVIDETAVITKGMNIKGDVSSQGSLDVCGTIIGNVQILGKLNISGVIEGNSTAEEVFADSANITGEIHAKSSLKVGQSSVIIGNVYATSAVIAGAIKGDIDVQGPVVLDSSAIVMGNIKSKAVQINNGAVIEGLCSQCYADVNPASFFKDLNK